MMNTQSMSRQVRRVTSTQSRRGTPRNPLMPSCYDRDTAPRCTGGRSFIAARNPSPAPTSRARYAAVLGKSSTSHAGPSRHLAARQGDPNLSVPRAVSAAVAALASSSYVISSPRAGVRRIEGRGGSIPIVVVVVAVSLCATAGRSAARDAADELSTGGGQVAGRIDRQFIAQWTESAHDSRGGQGDIAAPAKRLACRRI